MVVVNVKYTIPSGEAKTFVNELNKSGAVDLVRKESGCIFYQYFCSIETNSEILLVEHWKDYVCLKAHRKMPHMEIIRTLTQKFGCNVEVMEFETK